MESIDTGHIQEADNNKASPVTAYCLRNLVVLRNILERFSNPDLLELSLVNKFWNYEARCIILKRNKTVANFCRNGLCQDMQTFRTSLRQTKIFPFSGMRIQFSSDNDSCQCATPPLDPADVAFAPLPFTTLSVHMGAKHRDNQDCEGFLLAEKILQDLSMVIEELSLLICSNPESFILHYVQERSFPCLKVLKLEEMRTCPLENPNFLFYFKALLSHAPNLREVQSDRAPWILLHLVEGSTVVPVCTSKVLVPYGISEDLINSAFKLQRIELDCTSGNRFDFDKFNRIFPMMMRASCTSTLCELKVDAVLAASLMCYGFSFENVKKLTMGLKHDNSRWFKHRILKFVVKFNFTLMFPNLDKVHISSSTYIPKRFPQGMNLESVRQQYADLREPTDHRAGNIKELHLQDDLSNHNVQFLAQMFPNIELLYVKSRSVVDEYGSVFGSIREHFVDLSELHMKANDLEDTANFDCAFCGIFFDEVVQLMQKDEEFLKYVHIVPVMPSITCLKNLRVLNLEYGLKRSPDPTVYDVTNPMFFLSKVTGLIALARCPNLAVTLKMSPDGAQAGTTKPGQVLMSIL